MFAGSVHVCLGVYSPSRQEYAMENEAQIEADWRHHPDSSTIKSQSYLINYTITHTLLK